MKILLISINAKNIHKVIAPWYIKAYCEQRGLPAQIDVLETSVNDSLSDVLAQVCAYAPDVAGFSCYIWNIEFATKLASSVKRILGAGCTVVLGGPEVSFETSVPEFADYVVRGAGECAFYNLAASLCDHASSPDDCSLENRIINGTCVDFSSLPSPFTEAYFASFSLSKMLAPANQLIYYEASRGCPFSCAYCLSSTTDGVAYLPIERVVDDVLLLLQHGAACIKFVDRTFNANRRFALEVLEFIYGLDTKCTFHFEAAADLFDEGLLAAVAMMPRGRVQFEIGIQTVNDETIAAVSRKTDIDRALENIGRIVKLGNCHVHVDLIAGLPYETPETFAAAVDRVLAVRPHMLQIGFLKMLKGSRLREDAARWGYVYADYPPYEVLQSGSMTFAELTEIKGVADVVDKFYNSGMYVNTVEYALRCVFGSGYEFFSALARFDGGRRGYKGSLKRSYEMLFEFLMGYADEADAGVDGSDTDSSAVVHWVKLDCLMCDPKGMLPDGIVARRDKGVEAAYKKRAKDAGSPVAGTVRAEFFAYDGVVRVFVFDEKGGAATVVV